MISVPTLSSGHPGNFVATKLGKKVLKAVTFRHPVSYYSKFNYYEENIYNLFGRYSSPSQRLAKRQLMIRMLRKDRCRRLPELT